MMLLQLHWQSRKTGKTEFCSQIEINDDGVPEQKDKQIRAFVEETKKSHPLPDGYIWMMCNESSPSFLWQRADN